MTDLTIKEFITKYCVVGEQSNGCPCLVNIEGNNECCPIGSYAGMFLDQRKTKVFQAVMLDKTIEMDYFDYENEEDTDVEVRIWNTWSKVYTEDTTMTKVFEDCLQVGLEEWKDNIYMTEILNEYLSKNEL